MKKPIKTVLKSLLALMLALILAVGGYVVYVLLAYYRVDDNLVLSVVPPAHAPEQAPVRPGEEYKMLSYNIGFGAYEADYGFFMDGGTQSWAWSEERLMTNLDNISALIVDQAVDFCLLQEVDMDSTRSYHVDQAAIMTAALPGHSSVWAQNYDSPFLFYPFTQPHGASLAGQMTFSAHGITSALRRSLPIEDSLMKLVDCDRCYSVSRVPVEGGGELVIYNVHLSAYTSDGTIADKQLQMLIGDMQAEYAKGNYVICGGDFNKDLLGDSGAIFGVPGDDYTWAQPLPTQMLQGTGLTLAAPFDSADPVPSCRNADGPYHEGQFVITVDGFIVSDNVTVNYSRVIDTGFAYSDHNPVVISFILEPGQQ